MSFFVDYLVGSDTNAGSVEHPFKTIQAAVDAAAHKPYATVNLRGGTHYLATTVQISAVRTSAAASRALLFLDPVNLGDVSEPWPT